MTVQQLIKALEAIPLELHAAQVIVTGAGSAGHVQMVRAGLVTEQGNEIDSVEVLSHWSAVEPFEVVAVLVATRDR